MSLGDMLLAAVQPPRLPAALARCWRSLGVRPTRHVLAVNIARQQMRLFERVHRPNRPWAGLHPRDYVWRQSFRISTSRFGLGQQSGSHQTPLGLHRIARKIGGGQPIGTVYKSREVIGRTWAGLPQATIVHRILWLEGLQPGFNQGGDVDTFWRYIYLHGFSDETTLGRPQSHGCVHVAADDLLPLFDLLPCGTLVWIAAGEYHYS